MSEWAKIREMYYHDKKSIRQITRETKRSRKTIQKMVRQELPPSYQRTTSHPAPILGPYHDRIREMLLENLTLPKKQRWTSPRIFKQLKEEGYEGAESTVRHYVGSVRKELKRPPTFLPLEYDCGEDAQVDWGEAVVILNGIPTKVQTFHMTLSYSRCHFMMAFPSQKQSCFHAGHVAAFEYFGGIPQRISYDNLKTAVYQMMKGKVRIEQDAFTVFRSHYRYQSNYCSPRAGHEKGIVEKSVGHGRRQFLSPPPSFANFKELNEHLYSCCEQDKKRTVHRQKAPIGEMFAEEKERLSPLPTHRYDCSQVVICKRNKYSQIQIHTNRYSLPADAVGTQFTIKSLPFEIQIFPLNGTTPIAIHERCYGEKEEILNPLHYLSLLEKRPHALPHAKPIRQWRKEWPKVYTTLLTRLQEGYSRSDGNRMFIQILQLHEQYTEAEITEAIEQAIQYKTVHLEGIRYWLKTAQLQPHLISPAELGELSHLEEIGTAHPSVAQYDRLYVQGDSQ